MRWAGQGNALCVHPQRLQTHMISVQSALAHIEANKLTATHERLAVEKAIERIIAEPLQAHINMPPFSASNMDGYAVCACGTGDELEIIGESAAGTPFTASVATGQAVRISTGAMIPQGADRVLIQENCDRIGQRLTVKTSPKPDTHIRSAGSDFRAGDPLLTAGHRLRAADLTLLAAAGHEQILVKSKPRIALFSTGNELRPAGAELGQGEIYAANAVGLSPLLEKWGAEVTHFGVLRDDPDALVEILPRLTEYDLIIPIGGASVGDHDHMRPAFQAAGFEMIFDTVALRPGKPSWMAKTDHQIVLGLPGNPASSSVCAYLFLRPLLGFDTQVLSAKLDGEIEENDPRETYLRGKAIVKDSQIHVSPLSLQDSFRLQPQSDANALLRIPPMGGPYRSDDLLDIILIDALATR